MPYVVRNARPRARESLVATLRAERRNAVAVGLWAVAVLCLVVLAGHLAGWGPLAGALL